MSPDPWTILQGIAGLIGTGGVWKLGVWTYRTAVRSKSFFEDVQNGITGIHRIDKRTQRLDARQAAMMNLFARPIFVADTEGNFTQVNHEFETLVGYNEKDLTRRGWLTAVHYDDREDVEAEWDNAVDNQRIFNKTFRYVHRDGYTIAVRVESHPLRCSDGNVFGFQGVVDIRSAHNLQTGRDQTPPQVSIQ